MKILVTGICGFVGSTIAKHLREQSPNDEIFGIDNLSRSGSWMNKDVLEKMGVKVYHGDLRMASDLEGIPKAEWVIDAAANASVLAGVDGKSSSLQLVQNNLFGTVNLLEYCKKHRCGFILLSTSRVYSISPLLTLKMQAIDNAYIPDPKQTFPMGISSAGVDESHSTAPPISLYGSTKLSSEQLALEYGLTYQFPVWINRCGVMGGPGQFGHPGQGIFAYWIHSFREARPLTYIGFGGTGLQVRDCLHPRDLIPLIEKQIKESEHSIKPRILNVSGGVKNSMSLLQLSTWCQEHVAKMGVRSSNEDRPFDIPWMVLNSNAANTVWNWAPATPINTILQEIAVFSETQPNWCSISA